MKLVHNDDYKLMFCISCSHEFHYGIEIRDPDGFGYYHICPKCIDKAASLIREDPQKQSASSTTVPGSEDGDQTR